MTRRMLAVGVVAVLVGLAGTAQAAEEGKKYGEGVTLTTATPIATLLATPESYVGKKIRVDGVVKAVCEEMGCWIELTDPDGTKALRFKVEDGVIVFPVSAKGRKASAEGTLVKVEAPATAGEHDVMHAADGKEAPKPAAPGAATTVTYLVRATGAVVY